MARVASIFFRIIVAVIYLGAAVKFSTSSLGVISKDTIGLSNSIFVIFASLAALSFSYANVIPKSRVLRETVIYAGERFLHGSLWILSASAMKYLQIWQGLEEGTSIFPAWMFTLFALFPVVTFIAGLVFAFMGYMALDTILFKQLAIKPAPKEVRWVFKP